MRIGVNLVALLLRGGGGMRQYAMQLLPELVRQSDYDFVWFYANHGVGTVSQTLRRIVRSEQARVRLVRVSGEHEIYRHAKSFDLLFSPMNGTNLRLFDRATVVTLADIQERFFPEYFSEGDLHARSIVYPQVARTATRLITISEFSKQSICQEFAVDPGRVKVTYLAPTEELVHARSEWPRHLPALPGEFFFYPANFYKHKNHELLFQAMAQLHARGLECSCVLTGHPVQPGINLLHLLDRYRLRDHVRWYEHVPLSAMKYLYENARALCFPSEFEGFGLPIVEAMSNGCPVVTTATTSIPEVGGSAALYVDPDPASLAEGLGRVWQDPALRDSLASRGREQSARFSVERLGRETLDVLREARQAFFESEEPASPRSRVTFVVDYHPNLEVFHSAIEHTAREMTDCDEMVVLGLPKRVSSATTSLLEHVPNCRRYSGGAESSASRWFETVVGDYLFRLDAGYVPSRGAVDAAITSLESRGELAGVVGEILRWDSAGCYHGPHFVPERLSEQVIARRIPSSACVWRVSSLKRSAEWTHRDLPTNWILRQLPQECVGTIPRTMAVMPDFSRERKLSPSQRLREWSELVAVYRASGGSQKLDWRVYLRAFASAQKQRAVEIVRCRLPVLMPFLKCAFGALGRASRSAETSGTRVPRASVARSEIPSRRLENESRAVA